MAFRKIVFLLWLFAFYPWVVQGQSFGETTGSYPQKKPLSKSLSGYIEVSFIESLFHSKNKSPYQSQNLSSSLSYSYFENYLSFLSWNVENQISPQPLVEANKYLLTASFGLRSHPKKITENLSQTHDLYIIPPTNPRQRDDSLQVGVSLGGRFSYKPKMTSLKKMTISYSPRMSYYSYRFIEKKSGRVNTPWRLKQSLSVLYRVSQKIRVFLSADYLLYKNYHNDLNENYSLSQFLYVDIRKNISASIGHSNSSQLFKPNYRDYNISLIDDNNSVYFVSALWGF